MMTSGTTGHHLHPDWMKAEAHTKDKTRARLRMNGAQSESLLLSSGALPLLRASEHKRKVP